MKFDDTNIQILELLTTGLTVKEIGLKVCKSHRTVEARITKMKKQTNSKSYGHLIAWFNQNRKLYEKYISIEKALFGTAR